MTALTRGDIAIVGYNSNTDSFSFVLFRDIDAGTVINFTDNGWETGVGLRSGEGTVSYTAPAAVPAGTVITLSGLDFDATGDQIIAYQGDALSPTVLYLIDFADGNSTVAPTATNANTTGLPPCLTLGANAAAVPFDQAVYAGPIHASPAELFAAVSNSANWIDSSSLPVPITFNDRPRLDLDGNNSTHLGRDYATTVTSGGAGTHIADTDIDIAENDNIFLSAAEIRAANSELNDGRLAVSGTLPFGIFATGYAGGTPRGAADANAGRDRRCFS